MTIEQYLIKMESQLENTLSKNLKKYIPAILERIEAIALEKFIKEGDPVLDLKQFKEVFDNIVSESLNRELEKNKSILVDEGLFQVCIIKDKDNSNMAFSIGLN
tara:strand:- start:347 stop:658 length:312 start_codon:yes stop_codon:yes gene_type:complete